MKCVHGSYIPAGETIAIYCKLCWPDAVVGPTPILPRSSADPLSSNKTDDAEFCADCGCLRTYFSTACRGCGAAFPLSDSKGRVQGTANLHQAGSCPACSSTIHYVTDKKGRWECSECGTTYPAPKRQARR